MEGAWLEVYRDSRRSQDVGRNVFVLGSGGMYSIVLKRSRQDSHTRVRSISAWIGRVSSTQVLAPHLGQFTGAQSTLTIAYHVSVGSPKSRRKSIPLSSIL